MSRPIETTVVMDLSPRDREDLVAEWRASHAISSPLCQRREQREHAAKYRQGLRLDLPRTAIEPLVLALAGVQPHAVRARPPCIRAGSWDDPALLHRHWQEVDRDLGEDDGVLILDGGDVPHQGHESVGVKRQEGGALGQRANGHAGVFLGSASRPGYPWLDRRLSRPQAWRVEGAYAERRHRGGGPRALTFTPHPRLGWERSQAVRQASPLPCRWVTGDDAFGRETAWVDRLAGVGLWSVAEVPHASRLWRHRPVTAVPAWSGQGRTPTRPRVLPGEAHAAEVAQVAASRPANRWVRRNITEGSQGPVAARVARGRVMAVRQSLPGPEVGLVRRRHMETGELKTDVRHAPASPSLATVGRIAGRRWPIATCGEDGTPSLRRGAYAVRRGRGWHHHMPLVSLAHCCLVRLRLRFNKSAGPDPAPGAGAAARGPAQADI